MSVLRSGASVLSLEALSIGLQRNRVPFDLEIFADCGMAEVQS